MYIGWLYKKSTVNLQQNVFIQSSVDTVVWKWGREWRKRLFSLENNIFLGNYNKYQKISVFYFCDLLKFVSKELKIFTILSKSRKKQAKSVPEFCDRE